MQKYTQKEIETETEYEQWWIKFAMFLKTDPSLQEIEEWIITNSLKAINKEILAGPN